MESGGEHQGHSLILWFPSSEFSVYLQTIRTWRRGAGANRGRSSVCSDHNITAEHPHKEADVPCRFVTIHCEMEALKMGEAHKENGRYGCVCVLGWGGGGAEGWSRLVLFKHVDVSNWKLLNLLSVLLRQFVPLEIAYQHFSTRLPLVHSMPPCAVNQAAKRQVAPGDKLQFNCSCISPRLCCYTDNSCQTCFYSIGLACAAKMPVPKQP